MTQNVKDLVVPVAMVGALLAQVYYLGRASQRLDQTVMNVAKVAEAEASQERSMLALQADMRDLERSVVDLREDVKTHHLQWEKDHYQLLARRVVQP